MSKYKASRVEVAEGVFDSKKEYKRYLELKNLEAEGVIADLRRQVPYELIPKQIKGGKTKERACTYKADFVYNYKGTEVVEDVKGYRKGTAYSLFSIKRKLMLYVHGIEIREV